MAFEKNIPAPSGGMSSSGMFVAASVGMDILSGLFGYFASKDAQATAESRGRMLRMEAETDAQRYAEQAESFKATQAVSYLKSGVKLSGSPLDVLDETTRVANENISAIRARGAAGQLDARNAGAQAAMGGRSQLLSSITGSAGKLAWANYQSSKTAGVSGANRKDIQ